MWDHAILFLCDVNWFRTRADDGCRVLIDDCKNKRFLSLYMTKERREERKIVCSRRDFISKFDFLEKDSSKIVQAGQSTDVNQHSSHWISTTTHQSYWRERERRKMYVSRSESTLTMHTTHFGGSSSVTFDEEYKRSVCWFVGENLDGDQTDAQRFSWYLDVPWITVHGFLASIFAER